MENPNSDKTLHDQLMSDTISSEAIIITSQSSSTTRSYECTFCKRGFTNAQALGGHMNIHRKDKAKLKQQAFTIQHETKPQQHSLEITKTTNTNNPSYSSPNLPIINVTPNLLLDQERKSDHNCHDQYYYDKDQKTDDHDHDHEMAGSGPLDPGLDLELRLGPEPLQDSSSSTSVATKKFF